MGPALKLVRLNIVDLLVPTRHNRAGIRDLDLLCEAPMINLHQGVVSLIGRTANGVSYKYHAIPQIHRAQHRGENAHVCF